VTVYEKSNMKNIFSHSGVPDTSCGVVTELRDARDSGPGLIAGRIRGGFLLQNTQTGWGPTQRPV